MGGIEGFIYIVGLFSGAVMAITMWLLLDAMKIAYNRHLEHNIDSKIEMKDVEIMKRVHSITDYKIEGHEVRCHKKKGFIWILI